MLGRLHSEAAGKVRFYMATLEMESPLAAQAYRDLRNQTRKRGALYRDWAWQQTPIADDSSMALNPPFHHDNDEEERLCISCMRHDLRSLFISEFEEVQANSGSERLQIGSERPPVVGVENAPRFDVSDCTLDWSAKAAHVYVELVLPLK
jgi:hypothetical protein